MNSIDKNQPERNEENLNAEDAINKIKEIVKSAPNCFFCTGISSGGSDGARPMNVREIDDQGNLWFLSADDSHKNKELTADHSVKLYFQGSEHSDFLQLNGEATILRDKAKIQELWEPIIKTWFTEGVDDPRITVISDPVRWVLLGHQTRKRYRRYQNAFRCNDRQDSRRFYSRKTGSTGVTWL
jgi:general stress protein 26